jgi:2-polyprenyl-3-methyl-5-hydroxy-6-metoxy-1,4-benzoquinol methylase
LGIKCICCGSDEVVRTGKIPSVINFAGRLLSTPLKGGALVRCRNCSMAFRYPQLDKNSLDELYRQGKTENWQVPPGARTDWQIARHWLSTHLKLNSAILDIGCFDGGFLRTIEKAQDRYGIEIHEEAGKKAQERGIRIIGKDFADLKDVSATFDAVTSFDVIEHTQNPLEFLGQMVRLTKDGGMIIFSTGNSNALSWKLLGSRYWYCTIGEHLSFINPRWCEWVGKQHELELKQVIKFSHAQASWKQRFGEIVKNLFYAASPRGFAMLRQKGMGGDEYRTHKEMLYHPPTWMSAKDHFICVFAKKCTGN